RFGRGETAKVIATARGEQPFPVGTTLVLEGRGVLASVLESGRPARVRDYADLPGTLPAIVRAAGAREAFGVPIVVDRQVWGAMVVFGSDEHPVPADAEARLPDFTELVATAIANADARDELTGLAEEQAALHRIAALVAQGTDSSTLFAAVCMETGR